MVNTDEYFFIGTNKRNPPFKICLLACIHVHVADQPLPEPASQLNIGRPILFVDTNHKLYASNPLNPYPSPVCNRFSNFLGIGTLLEHMTQVEPVVRQEPVVDDKPPLLIAFDIVRPLHQPSSELLWLVLSIRNTLLASATG